MSATKTKPAADKAEKTPAAKKGPKVPDKQCQCNAEYDGKLDAYKPCGRLTTGRFAPGHDAKLKGALIKAAREQRKIVFVDAKGDNPKTMDPHKVSADLGWGKYTDHAAATPKKPKAERKSKEVKQVDAAKRVADLNAKLAESKARRGVAADGTPAPVSPIKKPKKPTAAAPAASDDSLV